ncbi:MAG: PIN domain-containing protein, partial [Rothia aeria]
KPQAAQNNHGERHEVFEIVNPETAQAQILQQWFSHELAPEFAGRILPVSLEVALTCAELHVLHKKSEYDALIGATAREHHLMLVTRNVADFQGMGLDILNPFEFHV